MTLPSRVCGIFWGPMASGKTDSLLACAKLLSPQFDRIVGVKSSIDTRWGNDTITARSGIQMKASSLDSLSQLRLQPRTMFVVDEAQFFPDLLPLVQSILAEPTQTASLICAGLHEDKQGKPFGQVTEVSSLLRSLELGVRNEEVHIFSEELHAICNRPGCGSPAAHTECLNTSDQSGHSIRVGDIGDYQPACTGHFQCSEITA